jgi:Tfp pilus assembly protein PilV
MISRSIQASLGFSLIEALFATAVLIVGAGSLAQLVALSAQANRGSRNLTLSSVLAGQQLEQLRATPFGELAPSPPGTLVRDTSGYVDFLDATGSPVGRSSDAEFTRRWSVEPLPASPATTLVFQVIVTTKRDRGPIDARLVGVKTRRAGS